MRWRQRVRDLLSKVLVTGPDAVSVRVRNGVVILGGQPVAGTDPSLVPVAVRLTWARAMQSRGCHYAS